VGMLRGSVGPGGEDPEVWGRDYIEEYEEGVGERKGTRKTYSRFCPFNLP